MFSFSFNGIRKDYVHMLRGRKRPPWPTLARNILTVPGRPGGYLQGTEIQPRIIEVPIVIKGQNISDLQKLKEDLASWLVTDEPKELVFDDEPDRTYYAVVDETIDFDEIAYLGQGTVRFLCPDPYKYGPLCTQTINDPVSGEGNPIVTNEGTAETYPTFTAYVKQPITFLDIIAPDAYMRVGQPYEVSQTPVDGDKPVMQDKMTTTTGWGAATSVVDGIVQGTMVSDGERFVVQSYGPTYNGWAGPALKKSLPYAIQNFRMYSLIQIHSSATGTGRIEIYGLDTANNIVFRTTIADFWPNTKMVRLQCELGTSRDMAWMTYGKKKGNLNYYYGAIDIRRKGNRWEFYTARVDNTGHLVDFVRYTYIDTKNKYTASLAQIQVHIGCHMSYGPVDHMSINHLYVYELRDHQENEVPYIAYTDDVLQFDHKNAIIYRNGEPILWAKDFGARFFPLGPGATELVVNPSDAATVEVEYRPRYK